MAAVSEQTNDALLAVVPAVLLVGVVGGLVLRKVRPETIALLAHDEAAVELSQ